MNTQLLKEISERFARGDMEFVGPYLADGVRWNVLGEEAIVGREQVLEVSRMLQLQSFPRITIKNVVSEGELVVVESTGEAVTNAGKPYNQTYCEVFRFVDGQLGEVTTYLDTALSREALS
jgi:ketosteroid isomerase-like protein